MSIQGHSYSSAYIAEMSTIRTYIYIYILLWNKSGNSHPMEHYGIVHLTLSGVERSNSKSLISRKLLS